MSDVTQILAAIDQGDPRAAEQLLPLVYGELRKLAAARLAHEKPGQTLSATALVHEAYLRLAEGGRGARDSELGAEAGVSADHSLAPNLQPPAPAVFDSRGHFFAAAAEAMRRILIENARRKSRLKRGGDRQRADVELAELPTAMAAEELIALDEALVKLGAQDPVKAQLITLRDSGGLTIEQAAEVLNISRVTAFRYWTFARAWLHREITGEESSPSERA